MNDGISRRNSIKRFSCTIKRSSSSDPPAQKNKVQKNPVKNVVEEGEWVTVYGFYRRDIKLVLHEFDKCGRILEHVPGSNASNWVHILYQSGMKMNKDVILGVKSVDPTERQALNEEWRKKHASQPAKQVVDPETFKQAFNQRLCLLSRDGNTFYVLGETGNVYTHILFVFLHVLRMYPRDDALQSKVLKDALQSKILDDCQVGRICNMGSLTRSFAGDRVRMRFFYLRRTLSTVSPPQKIQLEIGVKCPYCEGDLNDVDKSNAVVECEACGEVGHESCLVTFKLRG
ncbi:hypothetical protein MKW94_010174 [Papaver nudicaule]|uniref:RRM Nup35-type domain-containing protein n=1 Tax=Papaver nudicaule TaxID=74823 RepID=A0AA41S514_PAPNU|nr:hypothetical protein [Papaver nudicaule]